jgi:hypothetical protein
MEVTRFKAGASIRAYLSFEPHGHQILSRVGSISNPAKCVRFKESTISQNNNQLRFFFLIACAEIVAL